MSFFVLPSLGDAFLKNTLSRSGRPSSPSTWAFGRFGACWRCLLRVGGCRDPTRYIAPSGDEVHDAHAARAPSPQGAAGSDLCGLCLGLLENVDAHRAALRGEVQSSGFRVSAYRLAITAPALSCVRHYILLSHLRAELRTAGNPSCCDPGVVDLKEALRWVFTEELAALGLSSEVADASPAAMDVTANCTYDGPANAELECFDQGAPRVGRKRRRTGGKGAAPATTTASPQVPAAVMQQKLGGKDAAECLAFMGGSAIIEYLKRVPGQAKIALTLGRDSVFLMGRYLKFSRRVPQSPWVIGGERKGESSVEEFIAGPVKRCFAASECRFHAEGREDIDVRMLGAGRPFVIEVRNPQRADAKPVEAESAVNAESRGEVEVRRLQLCPATAMAELQRNAERHRKTYVCVCWSQRVLTEADMSSLRAIGETVVQQRSPVRVLHRRGQIVRPRTVYWMEAKLVNAHYFTVRLSTQAGMYIKEFVHGDLGRTHPSLRSLLAGPVEILQLDVEGLEDGEDGGDDASVGPEDEAQLAPLDEQGG